MRIKFNDRQRMFFRKAEFQESVEYLKNPGCGWYHIYTFTAQPPEDGRSVEEEVWLDDACHEEQLALALIDMGFFRRCDLPEAALNHITQILDFFHRMQKQVILRFAYDTVGKGMMREPPEIFLVKRHMEQIGGIVCKFAADILVMQGVFVGNWGEMHGSKFLSGNSLPDLVNTLYKATEGSCFLAVRTPAQWRSLVDMHGVEAGVREKLALFNDGIFGSFTDMGTYGVESRKQTGTEGSWNRKEELEWQELYLEAVPNGGEVLAGTEMTGFRQAAEDMQKMHVSYLNSIYQPEQLNYWRQETGQTSGCWTGVNGYDYIGCHLGYRFVVRDASVKKGKLLRIVVENCGFANLCEEADCFLATEADGVEKRLWSVETDARKWKSGQKAVMEVDLSRLGEGVGEWTLFLLLKRKADGRSIRFANYGEEEKVLLGTLLL